MIKILKLCTITKYIQCLLVNNPITLINPYIDSFRPLPTTNKSPNETFIESYEQNGEKYLCPGIDKLNSNKTEFLKKIKQFYCKHLWIGRKQFSYSDKLRNSRIVLLVDNSGSMNNVIRGETSFLKKLNLVNDKEPVTRHDELIFSIFGMLHIFSSISDSIRVEIRFLNSVATKTDSFLNLSNIFRDEETLKTAMNFILEPPCGGTPLVSRFGDIFDNADRSEKIHIILFTDGEPSVSPSNKYFFRENKENFENEIKKYMKDKNTMYKDVTMNIIGCSNDKKELKYLEFIDDEYSNINLTLDPLTEFEKIKKFNENQEEVNETIDDIFYISIIGALDPEIDKLNEENRPTSSGYLSFLDYFN